MLARRRSLWKIPRTFSAMSIITTRFDILNRVAVGSGGLIYHALEKSSGTPVALKWLIEGDGIESPLDVAALLRVTPRLQMLTGSHVAQLLDVATDEEGTILVYHFGDGPTLLDVPLHRRMEIAEVIEIAAQLLTALSCGERNKWPHGDVKGSNVIVTPGEGGRPFVLLTDWGLSAFRSEPAQNSLPFMSPERLAGGEATLQGDFFSLGTVLFFALTARPLVSGYTAAEALAQWPAARPGDLKTLRPDVPARLHDWICRLLELRPEKRPQTIAEARAGMAGLKVPPPQAVPQVLHSRPVFVAPSGMSGIFAPVKMTAPPAARVQPPVRPSPAARPRATVAPPAAAALPAPAARRRGALVWAAIALVAFCGIGLWIWMSPAMRSSLGISAEGRTVEGAHGAEKSARVLTPFRSVDVGGVGRAGTTTLDEKTGVWTIAGGGRDIFDKADEFHFANAAMDGDARLIARVAAVEKTNEWAKCGVMFRDSLAPDAMFADVVATPGGRVAFQWREASGAQGKSIEVPSAPPPVWVKIERTGDRFAGFFHHDGKPWTPIGEPVTIAMGSVVGAGLAVTAHNAMLQSRASVTNFSLLPGGWHAEDIGAPKVPGGSLYEQATHTWTLRAGGADIWLASDQFHFVSRAAKVDETLTTRVVSIKRTDAYTKAGLMFREGASAKAPNVAVVATPDGGVFMQWREKAGGESQQMTGEKIAPPVWLRLTRKGDTFSGAFSADGAVWKEFSAPRTVPMSGAVVAGMCATAHEPAALTTAVFAE
jgi:regulation of enolase protein 1 (concanavalin A-like superfamily)